MFVGALLLLGTIQAGAPASDAANMADLRCVAILSAAVMRVPEAQRAGVQSGVMFFYGRIMGRTPGFDTEGRMIGMMKADPEGKSLAGDNMRCAKEMQAYGQKLIQMGKRMGAVAK